MSTAAPAVAIPTRSEIEGWSTAHLADAASSWRTAASASEDAFDQHRQNISSPGGTTWEGDAKDAALNRVTRDIAVVGTQNEALLGAADTAENAVTDINAAKREVLAAITAAEADDFTVGEDLSVTDNRPYDQETAAARATAAMEHAEDIRWTAERLVQADSLAGQRLQTAATELEGIKFDGEGETDQGDPTIRMIDNKTEAAGPDGDKPAKSWEDMLLPPESTGEAKPAAEGAPKPDAATAADDAAKSPLDEMLLPDKTTDPDQPENLNEALDEVAGQPVPESPTLAEQILNPHTGTGKPGDPRYTKSPLESPIVNADPSVVDQQLARVEAARANVDAAEAAADSAAGRAYVEGAGAGPGARDAVPLGQNLFDARRELTEQTAVLEGLNQAAAESGLPTAEVPDLPANADKQAFTPEPSAFSEGSRALSEGSFGLIPDVAKDVETFSNWGEASTADRIQAVTDAAGAVPIPGAKLFGEGVEHGLDALGVAGRHSDDIPTTVVDDVADTASGGAHSVPDAPSAPHVDTDLPRVDTDSGGKGAWNYELNNPAPNTLYTVDDRFNYTTDGNGRVGHAEMTYDQGHAPADRNGYQQRIAGGEDRLPGDHGGHIFGSQFGGPGEAINITAMRDTLNAVGDRDYYNLETEWRDLAAQGSQVEVKVDLSYPGDSLRPDTYSVETFVDGNLHSTYHFDN